MKKSIIALTLALAAASAATAQNYLLDNPDNRPYFGARVGLDITSAAGSEFGEGYTSSPGFHAGVVYNIPLYMNLYFEPGLHAFYDTFGTRLSVPGIDGASMLALSANGSIRNFGFRIPFNFGYHFDFTDEISVSVYTGPVLNINVVARQSWNDLNYNGVTVSMDVYEGSLFGEGGYKRCDMQWQFGAGVSYDRYYLTVGGGVGMTNVFSTKIESFRRNTFNLAVGYNF